MENKIDKIAIAIGIVIGCVLGGIMSYSMLKDAKKCELLVEENKMLRDMLYEEQNMGD
jgi:branched-subunit amino acid aminotransferase/4-amino-4-deoxychorismate lyase